MRSHLELRAQRAAVLFFNYVVMPVLAFIVAVGHTFALYLREVARIQAATYALGDGVSPASVLTVDLPQAQLIHYDKVFIQSLRSTTPWIRQTSRRILPANSGNQLQLFRYINLGPNTTQATEGTVGTGLKVQVTSNTSRIGQYADFINISDMADQTALDPALENIEKLLAYRLATTLNTIVQSVADTAPQFDSSVNAHSKAANSPLVTADITVAVNSLLGRDVPAFDGGFFAGIIHNFIVGDLLQDNANNGIVDVAKRTAEGAQRLRELPSSDGDNVPVIEWGGVRFHASNLVKQTPNYLGSGKTALRTYIIGGDALFTVSLGATGNTDMGDGDVRNLKMWMKRLADPTGYDPSRMIAGFVSYNVKMTATLPPDTVQRLRIIDAVPVTS